MTALIRPATDLQALDEAARLIESGAPVALPTETVYGLAADASNPRAVAAVYEAKGRPRFNPLIAHVDSAERAMRLVDLSEPALRLAEAVWPGPLTLVGRRRKGGPVADLAAAGLDTLAVRWPRSAAMTGLIDRLDRPLVAPSANPSGAVSPTTAEHVREGLGERIDLILDGGPCPVGVESTIVGDFPGGLVLLRPGAVTRDQIARIAGPLSDAAPGVVPAAPGMLASHYAPRAALRLNADGPQPHEVYIGFGPHASPDGLNLSLDGDLGEAAANLFSHLRKADSLSDRIAVAPIPDQGLGEAINDRLRRAAAPRV